MINCKFFKIIKNFLGAFFQIFFLSLNFRWAQTFFHPYQHAEVAGVVQVHAVRRVVGIRLQDRLDGRHRRRHKQRIDGFACRTKNNNVRWEMNKNPKIISLLQPCGVFNLAHPAAP